MVTALNSHFLLISPELPAGEVIKGTHGDDSLTGSWEADTILGAAGDDTLAGGDGGDLLRGGSGADAILVGDPENLHVYDGGGNTVFGGDGDDYIFTQLGSTIDGGAGNDGFYLDLSLGSDGKSGATVDLTGLNEGGTASFGDTTLTGVEYGLLVGTAFADEITIGAAAVDVLAGAGDDHVVTAAEGFATGHGAVHGGGGDDLLEGSAQIDILLGDAGADTVIGGLGKDHLRGGAGADLLIGGKDGGQMDGDGGDDVLRVHGHSSISGGAGADHFEFFGAGSLKTVILDLHDEDIVDLSRVDADTTTPGHQHFTLVQAFDGHAGEAMVEVVGRDTYLRMDRDGDGQADASLSLGRDHGDFTNFVF